MLKPLVVFQHPRTPQIEQHRTKANSSRVSHHIADFRTRDFLPRRGDCISKPSRMSGKVCGRTSEQCSSGMGIFSTEESAGALEVDKVAPFLLKLYEIVSSPVSDDLVCWSEHGETFKIVNRTKFAGVHTPPA